MGLNMAITVPTDVLATNGGRPSAATVITISKTDAL